MKTNRFLSFTRVWDRVAGFGVFLGWTDEDLCLVVALGMHTLVIGPHYRPPPIALRRSAPEQGETP